MFAKSLESDQGDLGDRSKKFLNDVIDYIFN